MSKSVASSVLLAGAILLAILLPGCSDEPTPSPVAKILPSTTATTTSVPTATATATLTPTPTQTAMPTATPTPVPTATPTATPTQTAMPTATPTPVPTATPTATPTQTAMPTATPTPVAASPPPTWVFAGDTPEEHQTILREEMEYSRSYFSDRFGIEATGFTVLVGDHEWMSLMYRDMTGGGDFSLVVSPHLSSGHALVFGSATGGAVLALVYGYLPDESLISLKHDIIHEYFHVLQRQLAASGVPSAYWLVEGSAVYADYVYSPSRPGRRDFLNDRYTPYRDLAVRGARDSEFLDNLSAELARFEDPSAFHDSHESYPLSFISVAFLVEEHAKEEDLFVNYWKLLGKRSTWQQAFEEAFGIPVDDFYEALDEWTFPITRLVQLEIQLRLSEGQLSDIPGRPSVILENWGTWEGGSPGGLGLSWSHDGTEFYVTYPEGAVGTGYLSLWWSDDHRTYCLRGWYKDGDLTSSREDATAVEFTGRSAYIDWNIPAHPSTLPSLGSREQ